MLVDTALDGVEEKRGLKLNRKGDNKLHDFVDTFHSNCALQFYATSKCLTKEYRHMISSENQ